MRSAAVRAAKRRGSNIKRRPSKTPADNISSGTTVVFPAPGGAINTARPASFNAAKRAGMASWMGNCEVIGVQYEVSPRPSRGNVGDGGFYVDGAVCNGAGIRACNHQWRGRGREALALQTLR